MMAVKRLLIVINPISGGRSKIKLKEHLIAECIEQQVAFEFFETSGKEDAAHLAAKFNEFKPDALVAAGGDGTINLAASIILGTEIPLGIIPHGSANALSKELGIPQGFKEALATILAGNTMNIDTLKANDRDVFHIADIGFNARVVRLFSESTFRGFLMYIYFSAKEFFRYRASSYTVTTDNHKYSGKAFMIAFTNSKGFATNLNVNPDADIKDGYFEVSILREFPKVKTFNILFKLFNNTIGNSPYNEVFKTKSATLLNPKGRKLNIDGEHVSPGKTVEFKIVPGGLKVLVPGIA